MNSIYGVVTLYNPDIKEAADNINRYLEHIDHLLIWANSTIEDKEAFLGMLSDPDKTEFFQSEENSGVSKAINEAIKRAREGGFKYLLTMDQDSKWPDFPGYIKRALALRDEDSTVTITGPYAVEDDGSNTESFKAPGGIMYLEYVIVSGALYDVSMFAKTGDFSELYFIDAADEEFCLRAVHHGFKHAVLGDCLLMHQFGKRVEHNILGIKIITHNYTALRYYYSVRNHIWLIRCGYAPVSRRFRLFGRYVIKTFIRALLFEDDRKAKLSEVFRGISDGLSNEHRAEWRKC